MEFLMTYGWAILVVLVAIWALTYFGVFDQNRPPQEDEQDELIEICRHVAQIDYAISDARCTFSNHSALCRCVGNELLSPAHNKSHANSVEYVPSTTNYTEKQFYLRYHNEQTKEI